MGLYSNSLTGLTTSGGFKIPPAQGLIQFSLSDYNVATGAQDSITKLIAAKTSLTQARDTAMAQMKAGGTDAEIQKHQAHDQQLEWGDCGRRCQHSASGGYRQSAGAEKSGR